jgi:hypothetical protein
MSRSTASSSNASSDALQPGAEIRGQKSEESNQWSVISGQLEKASTDFTDDTDFRSGRWMNTEHPTSNIEVRKKTKSRHLPSGSRICQGAVSEDRVLTNAATLCHALFVGGAFQPREPN